MPSASIESNIPFRKVVFTGLIRDRQGRKMSKSIGNSPDPITLIEQYGADGLRFGLIRIAPQGQDIRYDEKQIEEGRNFCNKLWNAARFRALQGPLNPHADPYSQGAHQSPFASWILARLEIARHTTDQALNRFDFSTAAQALYDFVWNDFCARYIEVAKADFLNDTSATRSLTLSTCDYILSRILRLLHPFTPFVTEELWRHLGLGEKTIQFTPWPERDPQAPIHVSHSLVEDTYTTVDATRALRAQFNISSSQKIPFYILPSRPIAPSLLPILTSLIQASELILLNEPVPRTPVTLTPLGEIYLPIRDLIDIPKEMNRLTQELTKHQRDLSLTQAKLIDPAILQKAPAEKINTWKQNAEELQSKIDRLGELLNTLKNT
jgi:valyl-tRNA synthetase